MKITTKQIEKQLYEDFSLRYKAFGGFIDSEYWKHCLAAVGDTELLGHIIFCNDVMEIPPVHVFLRARPIAEKLSEYDKRAIGAFWGYVFRFVFGYEDRENVTARINTIHTASRFKNLKEPFEIVKK